MDEFEADELQWIGGEPYCLTHYLDVIEEQGSEGAYD